MDVNGTQQLGLILRARREGYRYVVCEGSTRSGKTHAICQALMLWALQEDLKIEATRKTFPALKRDAKYTFEEDVLKPNGLYNPRKHNQTDHIYEVGEGTVQFFSTDQEQKVRGPERDILYCNEANTLSREDFAQLRRRTRELILLDYNPTQGDKHWIDQEVLTDPSCLHIQSTYEHNPYLTDQQIRDIEKDIPVYEEADGTRIRDRDLEYDGDGVLVSGNPEDWAVYGLGKKAQSPHLVYPHWQERPVPEELEPVAYGLDFGSAVPSSLIAIYVEGTKATDDDRLYWQEMIYEAGLTTPQIIARMDGVVDEDTPIYADHEQDRIDQIENAGFLIGKANKSVSEGIDTVKQHQLCITPSSKNVQDEITSYKRRVIDGQVTDNVIKDNDHAMDGGRYGIHTHVNDPITPQKVRSFKL